MKPRDPYGFRLRVARAFRRRLERRAGIRVARAPPSAEAIRVGREVVDWLNDHYPAGFRAVYRDGDIDMFDPRGSAGITGWWEVAGPGGGDIEAAILALLQHAQDSVIEWTTDPGPAVMNEPTAVPLWFARTRDGVIEFGFEHGGVPVLTGHVRLG